VFLQIHQLYKQWQPFIKNLPHANKPNSQSKYYYYFLCYLNEEVETQRGWEVSQDQQVASDGVRTEIQVFQSWTTT
jgi:hypothetical protein